MSFTGCVKPAKTSTPTPTGVIVSAKTGALAPDFSLTTLDGGTVQLSQLRGKPVLVNFWATWCGPCRYEVHYLQASFEQRGSEVEFIAVDVGEEREKVRQFAEDNGMKFTIALDQNQIVAMVYNIRYFPSTFLIDSQGIIREMKFGAFLSKEEVLYAIEELLKY